MLNHQEKQDLRPSLARLTDQDEPSSARLYYFFRTRKRTFLVGMGVGLIVALVFLVLSLKVADPTLQYNPYRWISRPHEWLMLVLLVVETKILLFVTKTAPTLPRLLALVSLGHVLAAMVVYGVLAVLLREVVRLIQGFRAKSG